MENFYPAITGYAIVDILRNHMFIDKIIDAGIPAHFFICCKSWNNRPRELCTSLHQRFQRENCTSVGPLHVRRSPPIDLIIPDSRLGNMAHGRRDTQLLELPSQNLRDLRIVQTRRNSSINADEAAGKINYVLLVSINPTINLSNGALGLQTAS